MNASRTTNGTAGNYRIRAQQPGDEAAIYSVNAAAFPSHDEAQLVERICQSGSALVSLLAEDEVGVIGHILFPPAVLDTATDLKLAGLAPMAVVPERQNEGIGSELVRSGLQACREMGVGAVVVLGHPEYYPRFGFVPASTAGVGSEYEVPDEVFMVTELSPGYLDGYCGTAKYHVAFSELG